MRTILVGIGLAGFSGVARASEILVTTDISTSTTWTADNTYNLQLQIYVLPGATLTIEAGTLVASDTNIGGSLAVCRGAQIFVQGTRKNPVIMTTKADVATWTGGDPRTGTWRESCNEWGNLTVMGDAYISSDNHGGSTTNIPVPDPGNYLFIGNTASDGTLNLNGTWPSGVPSGTTLFFQDWISDPVGPKNFSASNGLSATAP